MRLDERIDGATDALSSWDPNGSAHEAVAAAKRRARRRSATIGAAGVLAIAAAGVAVVNAADRTEPITVAGAAESPGEAPEPVPVPIGHWEAYSHDSAAETEIAVFDSDVVLYCGGPAASVRSENSEPIAAAMEASALVDAWAVSYGSILVGIESSTGAGPAGTWEQARLDAQPAIDVIETAIGGAAIDCIASPAAGTLVSGHVVEGTSDVVAVRREIATGFEAEHKPSGDYDPFAGEVRGTATVNAEGTVITVTSGPNQRWIDELGRANDAWRSASFGSAVPADSFTFDGE